MNSLQRTTRKLWDQPEEDLPLLDSPLEVDSETPVADALIKRLKDEEEKQEGTCEAVCRLNMGWQRVNECIHSESSL